MFDKFWSIQNFRLNFHVKFACVFVCFYLFVCLTNLGLRHSKFRIELPCQIFLYFLFVCLLFLVFYCLFVESWVEAFNSHGLNSLIKFVSGFTLTFETAFSAVSRNAEAFSSRFRGRTGTKGFAIIPSSAGFKSHPTSPVTFAIILANT